MSLIFDPIELIAELVECGSHCEELVVIVSRNGDTAQRKMRCDSRRERGAATATPVALDGDLVPESSRSAGKQLVGAVSDVLLERSGRSDVSKLDEQEVVRGGNAYTEARSAAGERADSMFVKRDTCVRVARPSGDVVVHVDPSLQQCIGYAMTKKPSQRTEMARRDPEWDGRICSQ